MCGKSTFFLFSMVSLFGVSMLFLPLHLTLTPSLLQHHSLFLSAIDPLLSDPVIPGKDISIRIISIDYAMGTPVDQPPRPSTSEQTIVTQPAQWQLDSLPFSSQEYFRKLETRELGRTVLHTPVITSTQLPFTGNMAFCHALQPEMGVVWVATQQTQGKGKIIMGFRRAPQTYYSTA